MPGFRVGALWPLLLVVIVLGLDLVADAGSRSTPEVGALDEPAHLATGILVVALLIAALPAPPSVAFVLAALAASVAIDVDHIPQYLGWHIPHRWGAAALHARLITPVVLAAAAALARGAGSARSRWGPPSASAPT